MHEYSLDPVLTVLQKVTSVVGDPRDQSVPGLFRFNNRPRSILFYMWWYFLCI